MKKIFFGKDAREKIQNGINKCVDVVRVSLGMNGKNVLIYNGTTTNIINDGVNIAREVDVKDEIEQAGITLAKQCAQLTNTAAGDGTTTTLVLLQSLLKELLAETQLKKPRELRKQVFSDMKIVLDNLEKSAFKVKDIKDIENVATTASLNPEIGKMIADIFKKLGKDAKINIEETWKDEIRSEIVDGIQFESRNVALYSDEKEIYYDIPVLVLKKHAEANDLVPRLQILASESEDTLLVIAPEWKKDALALITKFKMQGKFKIAAVKNQEINEDDLLAFGNRVKKAIVTRETTTLIGGNGDTENQVKKIREKLANEESKYEREILEERISFLTGGIANIHVGKASDVERVEIKLKIEDAINSSRCAYQEGLVEGGGLALKKAGVGTLKEVCESPYKQICENSEEEIKIDKNVVDSLKVVKSALKNAVSVATSILTAEAALIEYEP